MRAREQSAARPWVLAIAIGASTVAARADEATITPDIVYGHKHGLALTCDMYRPARDPNGAVLLFMVSGGWYSAWAPPEQARGMFAPLTDRGYTVIAVRHGSSPKFGIPEAVDDVRRCVRYVRHHADRLGVDPGRIGVFGMSAGGHLSLMLATTADDGDEDADDPVLRASNRVRAVCAWVAPTDLRHVVWSAPGHDKQYERFPALDLDQPEAARMSPLLAVSKDDAPALLIAGGRDELVPADHSRKIHEALSAQGVGSKLLVMENAGHGFQGKDLAEAVQAMVAWFDEHLAPTRPADAAGIP
ncbi:MAG: alpha/beta hydrolase family protein [Planctomycetaceae bacterium]